MISVITTLYVLCSGLAVPALRAGLMIVCWCLCRAFLIKVTGWNILAISFLLLCLFSPEAVNQLGTQYSYGITAVLILGVSFLNHWCKDGSWQQRFMIANSELAIKTHKKAAIHRKIIMFCSVPVLAFFAGSMLTLRHQKLFLGGSIFTNFAVSFIVPLLFLVFVLKLLLGWGLPFWDEFAAWMINKGFECLHNCAEISLTLFDTVAAAKPSLLTAAIFYIFLLIALKGKNFYIRIFSALLAVLMLTAAVMHSRYRADKIMVLNSGSNHPPLIARLSPSGSRAQVCNLPDSWSGVLAAEELLRHGCNEAEIVFSNGKSANNNGLKSFSSRIKVTALRLTEGKKSFYFMNNLKNSGIAPEDIQLDNPVSEDDAKIEWLFSDNSRIRTLRCDDGLRVIFTAPDGSVKKTLMPWSNHVLIWNHSY